MSEVKRYLYDEQYPGQYSARCDLVPASAYDAAQAELAALREELAEIKESLAYRGSLLNRTQLRAEAAEQRNANYESMLRHFASCADVRQVGSLAMDFVVGLTKPTESGASA